MPSKTIYLPDAIYREVQDRVESSEKNISQIMQELAVVGIDETDRNYHTEIEQ